MRWLLLCSLLLGLAACDAPAGHSTQYPAMDSEAFNRFALQCSQCHAPPRPSTHSKQMWPHVVARMQQHRVERRLAPMSAQQQQDVLAYLQQYAPDQEPH